MRGKAVSHITHFDVLCHAPGTSSMVLGDRLPAGLDRMELEVPLQRMTRCFMDWAATMPRETCWKLARLFGAAWYAADGRHRRRAIQNLQLAFGHELDGRQRLGICRQTFQHLARILFELPYLRTLSRDNFEEFVTFEGVEHIKAADAKGKGVLVLASHFGNWEMMALAFPFCYRPIHLVVRPLDNPFLDHLISGLRSRTGNAVIPKTRAALKIVRLLRHGEIVAVLNDQNSARGEAVFVPFFGELASTNKALATLALRTDTPVVPVHNTRQADGKYRAVFEPEVAMIRTGDSERDIEANTALFNSILERYIRRSPEQWLWVHRRWRTRPRKRR